MTTYRVFIAVELESEIQNQIAKIISVLRTSIRTGVKWVPPQNIHLTLKFIGDFPGDQTRTLGKAISQSVAETSPFNCDIGQLGAFPNQNRPRIIWIGMNNGKDLASLAATIDETTHSFGVPLEERRFSPHLTIGRVSSNISSMDLAVVSEILGRQKFGIIGIQPVHSIALFKSDLTSAGAIYTVLDRIPLRKEKAL